jgi:hypothetical protein
MIQDLEKTNPEAQNEIAIGAQTIEIENVIPGMMLVKDVFDPRGRLVIAKGTIITEVLKYRLRNYFLSRSMSTPVMVANPKGNDGILS